MAIRGTGIQNFASSASVSVLWPSGTIDGDQVFIFIASAYNSNIPTGWTVVNNDNGADPWNSLVVSKNMTAADITAGSVTITFVGTAQGVIVIAAFAGFYGAFGTGYFQKGPGASSVTFPTTTSGGLYVIFFASNKANSTDTINLGTLYQQIVSTGSTDASGVLYILASASGPQTPTVSYSSSAGYYSQGAICLSFPVAPPQYDTSTIPIPYATPIMQAKIGQSYTETISAQGGTGPYTFAVTSGGLPSGLGLNSSTGVISGTATALGTSSFTITATDSLSVTGSTAFSITVISSGGGSYAYIS